MRLWVSLVIVMLAFIVATPICCILGVLVTRDLDAAFSRK